MREQKMKKTLLPLLFAFTLSSAIAQQKPTRDEVMEMLELSGRIKTFENMRQGLIKEAEGKFILTRRQKKAFTTEMDAAIRKNINKVADFYISEFTKQEISEMTAQAKSPIGKKMLNNADKYMAMKNQCEAQIGLTIEPAIYKATEQPKESNH